MFANLKKSFYIWINECLLTIQLARSAFIISRIKVPVVTVFGGAHVPEDNHYLKEAYQLGKKLVEEGFAVLTGGGPGIMCAANSGAYDAARFKDQNTLWSLGISVKGVDDNFHNPSVSQLITVSSFASRKYLLMHYSIGFIVLPGGIGTLNEVFELCNALKHNYMSQQSIIFVGKSFWKPLFDWLKEYVIAHQYAVPRTQTFFMSVDSIEEAVEIMKKRNSNNRQTLH